MTSSFRPMADVDRMVLNFRRVDTDDDGFLTHDELFDSTLLKQGGFQYDDRRVFDILFEKLDEDKDGKISQDEFVSAVMGSNLASLRDEIADGRRDENTRAGLRRLGIHHAEVNSLPARPSQ